jgi:hypothetical protein
MQLDSMEEQGLRQDCTKIDVNEVEKVDVDWIHQA